MQLACVDRPGRRHVPQLCRCRSRHWEEHPENAAARVLKEKCRGTNDAVEIYVAPLLRTILQSGPIAVRTVGQQYIAVKYTCCIPVVLDRQSLYFVRSCHRNDCFCGACGFGWYEKLGAPRKRGGHLDKLTALIAVLDRRSGPPNAAWEVVSIRFTVPVRAVEKNRWKDTE